MSRKTNGFVGTFSTSSDLEIKFPAVDHVGCSANVGTTEPFSKYWSDGVSWAGLNSTEIVATQALVSGAGNRRAVAALRHCGNVNQTGAVNTNYTYQQMFAVPFDFEAVGFTLINAGAGAAFDAAGIVAATGAAVDVQAGPTNGGAFANVLTVAGSSTLAVPAGPGGAGISVVHTAFTDCASVPRTDDPASAWRLSLGRFVITTAGNPVIGRSNLNAKLPDHATICGEYLWDAYYRSADNVTTNQAGFTAGVRAGSLWPNVYPMFLARAKVSSLAIVGDSTMGDNGGAYSPAWRGLGLQMAQYLNAARPYVVPYNLSTSGRAAADFHADAVALLPIVRPSVAVILAASVNTGFTAAQLRAQWGSLIKALRAATDAGVQPVIATPWPVTYGANAAARAAFVADLLAYGAANGVPVLDFDGWYGTGSGAARTWVAGTNYDANHPGLETMQDASARGAAIVLPYL